MLENLIVICAGIMLITGGICAIYLGWTIIFNL